MRKIIEDFYLTVLFPLALVVVVSLVFPVRNFVSALVELKRADQWKKTRPEPYTDQEMSEFAEFRENKKRAIKTSGLLALIWSVSLVGLYGFSLLPNSAKLTVTQGFWTVFGYASVGLFLAGIATTCYYVYRQVWIKFAISLIVVLLAAACAEHFVHLSVNTEHILCPHCDDADDDN
jgi:hypothetical protein